jgi:hypothetical protein
MLKVVIFILNALLYPRSVIGRSSGLVVRSREYAFFRGESAHGVLLMWNDNCKTCGEM